MSVKIISQDGKEVKEKLSSYGYSSLLNVLEKSIVNVLKKGKHGKSKKRVPVSVKVEDVESVYKNDIFGPNTENIQIVLNEVKSIVGYVDDTLFGNTDDNFFQLPYRFPDSEYNGDEFLGRDLFTHQHEGDIFNNINRFRKFREWASYHEFMEQVIRPYNDKIKLNCKIKINID